MHQRMLVGSTDILVWWSLQASSCGFFIRFAHLFPSNSPSFSLKYNLNIICVNIIQSEKNDGSDVFSSTLDNSLRPAVVAAAGGMSSPRYRSSQPGSPKTAGNFFELLTSSDFYKNTKVVNMLSFLPYGLCAISRV